MPATPPWEKKKKRAQKQLEAQPDAQPEAHSEIAVAPADTHDPHQGIRPVVPAMSTGGVNTPSGATPAGAQMEQQQTTDAAGVETSWDLDAASQIGSGSLPTETIPMSRSVIATRQAISPRFAISTLLNKLMFRPPRRSSDVGEIAAAPLAVPEPCSPGDPFPCQFGPAVLPFLRQSLPYR